MSDCVKILQPVEYFFLVSALNPLNGQFGLKIILAENKLGAIANLDGYRRLVENASFCNWPMLGLTNNTKMFFIQDQYFIQLLCLPERLFLVV